VAVQLPVLVHQPGHGLRVRPDVRGGDVAGWAEYLLDPVHERAGDLLQLGLREVPGGRVDASLGAAVWDPHDGRLPGHELGQRANLVEVDLGVVADAALVRTARAVVLHAVAREDVDLAVSERHRHLHLNLAVRRTQHRGDVVPQP
jgi:hypothetical protein